MKVLTQIDLWAFFALPMRTEILDCEIYRLA